MRVVVYERVSTQEQADSRLGLESQRRLAGELVAKIGRLAHEPIVDEGVSAGIPIAERRGGRVLVDLIASGAVDAVVALDQERLFRDMIDCIATLRRWHELKVRLFLVDGGEICVDDPEGFLTIGTRALIGEYNRLQTRRRTRRALAELQKRGRHIGPAPYGWRNVVEYDEAGERIERGRHEIEESEFEIVRRVHELARTKSASAIARLLNGERVPTRFGRSWTAMHITRILARPALRAV